jgi:hypothetical protein
MRRKKSNVDEVVSALRAQGLDVAGCACHVGSSQQRQALVQETLRVRSPSLHGCCRPERCHQPAPGRQLHSGKRRRSLDNDAPP